MDPVIMSWEDAGAIRLAWREVLERCGYNAWFTVTFRRRIASSIDAINRTEWVVRTAAHQLGIPCRSFIVAEQFNSDSSGWHTHGMLWLPALSGLQQQTLRAFWAVGFARFGRCRFSFVREVGAVAHYVGKYLVKRVGDHRFVGPVTQSGLEGGLDNFGLSGVYWE